MIRRLICVFIITSICLHPQNNCMGADETRALILVDTRLYLALKTEIDRYRQKASARRGFDILMDTDKRLDDFSYSEIFDLIQNYRSQYPAIQGVLAIGNIKLPSFYKARADILQVRLYPSYFEDAELALTRYYAPGAVDPWCDGSNDGYCQVIHEDGYVVPEHDFDDIQHFPTEPDIWTCYMPVGAEENDSYADFAAQLQPYFVKLLDFYNENYYPENKMYMVSNDLFGGDYNFWQLYGDQVERVDFYAMNPSTDTTCIESGRTPEECYQRAVLENYPSHEAFMEEYNSRYWMGEDWQKDSIYTAHLEANHYEFVLVNVHSWEQASLISANEALDLQNGGMIMLGFGCSVGGFKQPASPSNVTTSTYPADNILMNYLLGSSDFLAAAGAPFNRGHSGHFQKIIDYMKDDADYLGLAHLERMQYLYANAGDRINLKEQLNEILPGDPFLDVTPNAVSAINHKNTSGIMPEKFQLSAYPNPFNHQTVIEYRLPETCYIRIKLVDITGRELAVLIAAKQPQGRYQIQWHPDELASGLYFCILHTDSGFSLTRKLILLK